MEYDPIDVAAQTKRKQQVDEKRRIAREREEDDIRWLMGSKQGRRVMHRLLTLTGVYRSSFTGNSQTFFNEGQRNIGLVLVSDVQTLALEDFVLMLKEHQEDDGSSRTN